MKKQKNIDSICFNASFWPALGLVTLSVVIAIVLFSYQLDSIRDREQHRHELISELFIKSGSADIIIGNDHALYVMLQEYKDKYQLDDIRIEAHQPKSNEQKLNWSSVIKSAWSIPGIKPTQYVTIQSKIPNKDLLTPSISSFAIIALFVITSLIMFKRIKRKLNEQIIIPLGQTLKCDGNDLEWFNQDKAAAEIAALYERTHQFIKELHEQRDVIEDSNIKQAKYDVALQMAHDIRSPVLALETFCGMFNELSNDAKNILQNVAKRISRIASDVLSENKISLDPTKKVYNLVMLAKEILDEKELTFRNKKIDFCFENINLQEVTFTVIPEVILGRILSNLIDNAIEAIEISGQIIINLTATQEYVIIHVSDTGCGISALNLDTLFNKGQRSKKLNGNGLGLSSAKKAIENYGGCLSLISTSENGSHFELKIPLLIE
ncbi:MAG: sensor histidine kinase [Candidatus Berkiella sp.]